VRILAVANQKGGSGKTTTCVNLAAALAARGLKVLVIDLDPEASASAWLGVRDGGRGLLDVLTSNGTLSTIATETTTPGVSLVPSSSWLVGAERAVGAEAGAETVLRRSLERLPKQWDFVLLDCPPSLSVLTVNALAAAGELLAPVEASLLAVDGLIHLVDTVQVVRERLNPKLAVGILACRADLRTRLAQDVVEVLRKRYREETLRTVIRSNVSLGEAFAVQQPINVYAPHSTGAEDYRRLAGEVLRRRA
jgi:chromosome partitioning protein